MKKLLLLLLLPVCVLGQEANKNQFIKELDVSIGIPSIGIIKNLDNRIKIGAGLNIIRLELRPKYILSEVIDIGPYLYLAYTLHQKIEAQCGIKSVAYGEFYIAPAIYSSLFYGKKTKFGICATYSPNTQIDSPIYFLPVVSFRW